MSTFGKKSLVWWDYDDHTLNNAHRFNSTPKNIQIQILEKWYPIGSKFIKTGTHYSTPTEYTINGYIEMNYGWSIDYSPSEKSYKRDGGIEKRVVNPVNIVLHESFVKACKRQSKLERLL
jgi:hypothetical protein